VNRESNNFLKSAANVKYVMREIFVNRTDGYYQNLRVASDMIDNELTVSHMLRSQNGFTKSGLAYGAMLAEKLALPPDPRILEVGPGLGDLAANFCAALGSEAGFSYTFCDISFDVIKHLRSRFRDRRFSFAFGDFLDEKTMFTRFGYEGRFDLIICNEVVADMPTIVNMTLDRPRIREGDADAYYDAVSLAKFYGLALTRASNFSYGALKFLIRAKALLAEGGKIFVCEHSSPKSPKPQKPGRVGVFGHSEYAVDFAMLEQAAHKMKFRNIERGRMTDLLGIREDRKAVIFFTQPELKMLYNFLRKRGISLDQRAYEPVEVIALLEKNGVSVQKRGAYAAFLESRARPLREITDQFSYLLLESNHVEED